MTKLPSIAELIEENPGLDVAGYGAHLLAHAPPTQRFLDFEATSKRRMAQPLRKIKGMKASIIGGLFSATELLHHPSEKIQAKARLALLDVAEYVTGLTQAEGTKAVDEISDKIASKLRALWGVKHAKVRA